jgi:hypothetical protein
MAERTCAACDCQLDTDVGPWITQVALAATKRAARELVELGTYTALEPSLPFAELNAMFAREPEQRAK